MKNLVIVLLLGFLTSCGWHLRGTLNLPSDLKSVHVSGAGAALQDELARALTANGIALAGSATDGQYAIAILAETDDQRTAATGGDGLAAEYELSASVEFELRDAQGQALGRPETLSLLRTLTYDPNAVLSASAERALIRREMTRELAGQIIRRLGYLTQRAASSPDHGQTAP